VSVSPTLEVAGRQVVTETNTFVSWTVRGHDGTDTFNINDPTGSINTILIIIDAGAGIGDSLNYTTDRSQTYFPGSTSGSGELQSSTGGVSFTGIDTATVTYTGGFVTTVNAGAGANQITATGTAANTVAVTVDNNTTMNFVALQTLNLNAGSGDDVISVRPNALAITAINVDGGDPTASDTVIVNGTAAQDNVTIAPTAADAATVTGLGPTINVTTTEHLTYNGQGGGDNLTYTTLAGETDNFLTPGVVPDAGTINSRRTSGGAPLLPVSYTNLAASGTLIFADTGGGRADDLTLTGTDNPEIYNVTPTGDLQIRSSDGAIVRTVLIQTPGVAFLYLNGAAGDDVFNVSGGHPFTFFGLEGGDPSASDTLNFTSSGGAVTVDLAAQTVTEAGFSPVSLTGIEVLNVTAGAAAILINGTANPDNISVTPTSATEATIVRAGQNLTINTSNSSTLTIDPLGGSDNLRVNGTQAGETITVTGALVTVDALKTVNYANAENLQVFGQAGDDTFEVTPSATTTIFIDGGDPIGTTPGDCIHITAPVVVPEAGPEIDEGGFRFPGTTLQRVSFDHIECIVVTTDCAVILGTNGDDDITIIARDDSYDPLADGIQDFTVSVNGGLEILYTNTDHLYIDALAGDDDIVLRTPAPNNAVWDVDVFIAGGTPSAVTGDQGDVFELETPFAQDVIYTPTGSDSGHIDLDTVGGGAEIANIELGSWTNACGIVGLNSSIGGIEEFVYDGEGAGDNFTIVGTDGDDTIVHTPGAGRDEGTLRVNELLGVRYQNLGLSSILTVDGAAAVDTLVVQGTANSDVFGVAGTTGAVTLNNRIAVNQTVVENLRLNGLAGDDTFNLNGGLPYTNVVIDADATVNLAGAIGPVTVNLGDNSPGSANPNTVITGYGAPLAPVVLIGVDTANMDANGQTVTTIGTSQNDNIIYTPSGAAAGTFFNNISSGNNLVPNTVFNFSNAAAGSVFTVFGGTGGNADQVTIRGTDGRDLIQIQQGSATAQVLANNVTALMSVQLATNVEILNALGLGGQDTFQVIPAPGLGNSPDNLLINLDGGAGGENNALVVAGSFGAAPATLAANQFVVVNRGRTPDTGTVRVFTAAVPNPDINYKSVQVVSPLVAGGSVTPNSIFIGPDNFEQNDQLGNAAFLGAGSTLQVQHASVFPNNTEFPGVPSDQDFYRVVTQTTGTLDFQVYFRTFAPTLLPGGGQINLQLFDVDGTLIASAPGVFGAAPGTGNARIRIPAVQGQTYFLRVFGATADVVNGYDITVIDTAPPVPFDLELDDAPVNPSFVCPQVNPAAPNSDTGRSQFDNITCDNTPTIFLRLDDAIFLQDLPGNSVPDSPPAGVIPIPFQPGPVQPVAPGYAIAIFDEGDGTPGSTPPQVPLGFATAVAGEPGVYTFTPLAPLTDGSHFLTARVQMIDPAIPQQRGFGARSVSLEIIVDIVPPNVSFGEPGIPDDGVISDSDTGVSPTNPDTLIDLVTRDTTPTFWGRAEADAIIRVYADVDGDGVLTIGTDVFLGQDTAIPLDGTNQEPDGFWKVESVVSLIDPDFFPIGGERTIFVTAEDVAGNTNAADGTAGDTLVIFIDVQGPQITDVEINNVGNEYDLFDPKPSNDGPTPLVRSIVLSIQDLPVRTADFLIAAIKDDIAENPGHYLLTGDYNGIIPIQDVIVTLIDPVEGEPARATIELVFWEWEFVGDGLPFTLDDQGGPLPDDRYTLFVNDEGIIDRVGNILDGESNADEPHDQDQLDPEILGVDGFPSGDGLAGGDFIARFTIDSVAEVGTFGAGSAWIDTNGNTSFDPTNGDFTNRDITYILGLTSDDLFAGNFAASVDNPETIEDETIADGFDKLAAYGRFNGVWRWLVDTDNDGVPNVNQPDPAGINGLPVAGNFDGNPLNGDEVGVFTGTTWWFDTNHDFKVDTSLVAAAGFVGYPIVGDFDGDGNDDLAVWTDDRFKFDLSSDGLDGAVDAQFRFGFPGANERPVAADVNGDGFDDIGLFVPNQASAAPDEAAEWYILVSGQVQNNGDVQPGDVGPLPTLGPSIIDRIVIDPIDGQRIVRFTTKPFGRDIYLHYGDEFSLPLIGNFDPPVTAGANDLPSGGYNTRDAQDVNNDGIVSAIDALLVVNHLNRHGSTAVTQGVFTRAPFLDVNNNGQISATDALTVINKLNASASQATSGAEGEADEFFSALGASNSSDNDDVLAALANDLENQRRKKY
jgi:hypothetical protein